jgi:hypothetical protein
MSRKRKPQQAANQQQVVQNLGRVLSEALDYSVNYVDPYEDRIDPATGELWSLLGTGGKNEQIGTPESWEELKQVREKCRRLAAENEFAINGHENRISYIVGSGHSYDVKWKEGEESKEKDGEKKTDPELDAIKAVIDEFIKANKWHKRQQEIVRRKDRDGECFIRIFRQTDGTSTIRFVEPVQVQTPQSMADKPWASFGIETDPDDVETVKGYWIDGNRVDATEIQHRKENVDSNVKRGLPLFWPVHDTLLWARKILKNTGVVCQSQSAIAMIRKHGQASKAGLEQFVSTQASKTVTNSATGTTDYFKRYPAGTILDALASTEYEFPNAKVKPDAFVGALQAMLRAIASRLVMPEFMLTSDASNANYSSTMVAEGPAVKFFERCQWDMIEDDLELFDMVLRNAESAGKISSGILDRVEIVAQPPNVRTQDRLAEAQADEILYRIGSICPQTVAEKHDIDWNVEEERIAKWRNGGAVPVDGADPDVIPFPATGEDGKKPPAPPKIAAGTQPPDPAAQSGQQIQTAQDLVLNGAQIQAALSIVTSVAAGEMPRDAGIGQLQVLFNLSPQQAEQIMGSAGTSTPTTPNPRPNQPAEPTQPQGGLKVVVPATEGRAAVCGRISEALWSGYP